MMTNLVQFPRLGLELEIDRVAFSLGSLNIYWYGLIIAAGLLLALAFAFHYAPDFGVDADRLVDVCWWARCAPSSAPGPTMWPSPPSSTTPSGT